MDELTLKTFCLGDLYNNCYLIFDKESKRGFIVDAPAPIDQVSDFIQSENLKIDFVALTHAHFDHISGLDKLSYPFYLHQSDSQFLKDIAINGSAFFGSSIVVNKNPILYKDNKLYFLDKHSIEIIHTPGHTPGGVSLKLGNWLFSGDTLFSDAVGRTDIPLASHEQVIKSIKEKLLVLPPDTIVYPGHGASTTIAKEKEHNPFLK